MDKASPRTRLASYFVTARGKQSQKDFADVLGITQSHLSKIENEQALPSANVVTRLSIAAGSDRPIKLWRDVRGEGVAQELNEAES